MTSKLNKFPAILVHWLAIPSIAIMMTLWPSISSNIDRLQTDPGDPLLNIYFFEHVFHHFTKNNITNYHDFWSPDFFWPLKGTYAWSDHLIGPSVIYGLWRLFFNEFQSYIGWLSTTLFLNYVSIRWCLFRIAPQSDKTWITLSALICCFNPIITSQLGHPQILSLFIFGPILYSCDKLITDDQNGVTTSDIIGTLGWLLLNGVFNIYIFVFGCFIFIVCSGIYFYKGVKSKSLKLNQGRKLRPKLFSFLLLMVINIILYIPYLSTIKIFGKRGIGMIINNLPKISSWFYSSNLNLLPAPIQPESLGSQLIFGAEQELFPGWGFLILLVGAAITGLKGINGRSDSNVKIWLITVSLSFLITLNIFGISLWRIFTHIIPGANAVGASSRVSLILILLCGPLFAHSSKYWGSIKIFTSRVILISLGFISIWRINQYNFDLINWKSELKLLISTIESNKCKSFWLEPISSNPTYRHIQAMHAQLKTGIPTLNGYSGHSPKGGYPFTNSAGTTAYSWSIAVNSLQDHQTKNVDTVTNNCIINLNQKPSSVKRITKDELSLENLEFGHKNLKIKKAENNTIYFQKFQNGLWGQTQSIKVNPNKIQTTEN